MVEEKGCPVPWDSLVQSYLMELSNVYSLQRALHSSPKNLLCRNVHKMKIYGENSFLVTARELWNALPESIKTSPTIDIFFNKIKTPPL